MVLNIAVCDDDKKILDQTEKFLNRYMFSKDNIYLQFDTFDNPYNLLNQLNSEINYNVFLLDVEMPGMNGIELAKKLSDEIPRETYTVFISNYPEYMQESFSVHPFYYMQKPVTEEKLFSILDEISLKIKENHRSFLIISDEENEYPVDINNIVYIETKGRGSRKCKFHLFDKSIDARGNISEWSEKLKDFSFMECHRGIIVNISHIHYIHEHKIFLDNGENTPLSRRNEKLIKDEFINQVKTYLK